MKDNLKDVASKYEGEIFGMHESGAVHALGVARACYIIAREQFGMSVEQAKKAFILGWIHDIGYEFAPTSFEHADAGADVAEIIGFEYADEIRAHERIQDSFPSDMLDILYMADLLADGAGKFVCAQKRLEDIKTRHPESDGVYKETEKIVEYLREHGLLEG